MKKHILLIDDDEDELQIFMAALQDVATPCKCTYARSAEQGLSMLNFLEPDLIFVDYNMPKMDGLRFLSEVKKIKKTNDVPVILFSNCITSETNRRAAELGVTVCINKPSRISTFTAILQEMLTTDMLQRKEH